MTERFQRTINNDCRILSYVCSFRGQNCTGIALIIFTFFITYCLSTLKHIYHLVLTQSIKIEDCRWGPTRARQKRSITALKPLATLCLIQPRICLACLVAKGHGVFSVCCLLGSPHLFSEKLLTINPSLVWSIYRSHNSQIWLWEYLQEKVWKTLLKEKFYCFPFIFRAVLVQKAVRLVRHNLTYCFLRNCSPQK